ncbi:MAG: DegV family protein [Cellulosilyticum sp.]|nr:DegV family protein [Cellulosilyticum sp.]
MIKIVTDSTSYIPIHLQFQYDISIVSLGILLNGQNIREVDVPNEHFYSTLAHAPEIPSSSQPSPTELYEVFENILKQGHSIVALFISSEMSGTYASALSTKQTLLEKYPNAQIEIIDSRTNCMQLGYAALCAAKAAAAGQSFEEVIATANDVVQHSRFLFTPETLTYLKKGGRIGNASALLGTLLQIKPILTVVDGKTTVFTKVRTKKKAVEALITGLMDDLKDRDLGEVIVHHIHCPQEGEALARKLSETLNRPVQIQSIGPVIGSHVGPGSIGLAYYTVEKNTNK